jgi:hypothetical protein
MSPEQVHGDKTIDGRSDIYSLGVITFEMLTGQAPYHADTPAKLMMAHVLDPVPNVRQFKQNIPADCQMVVDRAMAKDRDQRFSTASEIAVTLGGVKGQPAPKPTGAGAFLDQTMLEPFPTPGRTSPPASQFQTSAPTQVDDPYQQFQGAVPAAEPVSSSRGFPMWIPVVGCALLFIAVLVLGGGAFIVSQVAQTAATQEAQTIEAQAAQTAVAQAAVLQTQEVQAMQTAEAVALITSEAAEAAEEATQEAVETITAAQTAAIESLNATSEAATIEANDPANTILAMGENWPLLLADTFDEDINDWCLGESNSEFAEGFREISGGKYRWETTGLQDFFRYCANDLFTHGTNFYMSGDSQLVGGSSNSEYGLIIRWQDGDNHIIYRIEDSGSFQVRIQVDGEWETIVDQTDSPFIRPGGVNTMAVVAENSHYTLFINDVYVGEFDETRFGGGYGGYFISLNEGQSSIMEFDNFVVRSP